MVICKGQDPDPDLTKKADPQHCTWGQNASTVNRFDTCCNLKFKQKIFPKSFQEIFYTYFRNFGTAIARKLLNKLMLILV
jgi:hypothetical protein